MSALVLALFLQTRMASDFELQQMQQQVERSHDFLSQVSGRLNLAQRDGAGARGVHESA